MAFDFPSSPTVNQTYQSYTWDGEKWFSTIGGIAVPVTPGTEAAAFLARTSGLDATHTNAYATLINGLVADGIWTKIDVLYIFATNSNTHAILNLKSSTYNGTVNGAPAFTADRGFQGTEGSTTAYINTGFNMTGSPQYGQNSAHQAAWIVTNGQGSGAMGWYNPSTQHSYLRVRDTSDLAHIILNDNNSGGTVASTDSRGFWHQNRSGSTASQLYKNGVSFLTNTTTSTVLSAVNHYILGWNVVGGNNQGYGQQVAAASIGSSLDATQAANYYARMRTYMTAVGVP